MQLTLHSQSSILRYHALTALQKSLMTAKRAVGDTVFKDILKQMKAALADKSLPVQRAAAAVRTFTMFVVLFRADAFLGLDCNVFFERCNPIYD